MRSYHVLFASLVWACSGGGDGVAGNEGGTATGGTATGGTSDGGGTSGGGTSGGGTAGGGGGGGTAGSGGATSGGSGGALPYPTRSAYRIKGLQPDFWPNRQEVSGNNAGGIAVNLVWASWEPSVTAPPCNPQSQEELDGHCFTVQPQLDDEIREYSKLGVVVTGVVYGVPEWARIAGCSPIAPGYEIFCAPKDAKDYGRFARMLARRYDGTHGHGRVADFVVHNEVNTNDWFDVGCGQGKPCDVNQWLDAYAASYSAAYDGVAAEQPNAKVLVSLDHHFGPVFDTPGAQNPKLGGQTFLSGFASRVAPRKWRVAFHSYPPDLLASGFSPLDFPKVTFGNLGVLAGWLRRTFPSAPHAWEIQLTENGINALAPSSPALQSAALCAAFQNVLGTPGVESFIYHRMRDHSAETAAGLGLGLRDEQGNARPAWTTWALANRNDTSPPQLSCGFDVLPYARLTRSSHPTLGHWVSTRRAPAGFAAESSYRIEREPKAGTTLLYECLVDSHNLLTASTTCEGQTMLGPVGWVYSTEQPGSVALHRCRVGAGQDHFVSTSPTCEGQIAEQVLGYALP